MNSHQQTIGITLGDPAGIGPEVVARALAQPSIRKLGRFHLIGEYSVYRRYCPSLHKNCLFTDLGYIKPSQWRPGRPSTDTAMASLYALRKAVDLLKKKDIAGLVTAPVCKEAIYRIDPTFHGHTEFMAVAFGIKNAGMMFVADGLRTVIVTRHIPLHKVSTAITQAHIYDAIDLTYRALTRTFNITRPVIAVCGLNPHAGEGGTIGTEEITKIVPAIQKAKRRNIKVCGPFPADTLFTPNMARRFDAVIAMYHDQGLIPIKTLFFTKLVNLTIGLPFIRTSPAHGTAFDIAGKHQADPSSMIEAIKLAARLTL